jgi:hypothetical protein
MRLHARDSLQFAQITHHKKTTQCLGALGDSPWYAISHKKLTPPQRESEAEATPRAHEPAPDTKLMQCPAALTHFAHPSLAVWSLQPVSREQSNALLSFSLHPSCSYLIVKHVSTSGTWHAPRATCRAPPKTTSPCSRCQVRLHLGAMVAY